MSTEAREVGHEARDAAPRPLLLFALYLTLLIVAVFAASAWLDRVLSGRIAAGRSVHPMADFRAVPHGPLLQAQPATDLEHMRQQEASTLGSYGWIDREQGVVRIPIERAMDLALERGFPTRETGREAGEGGR
jgi:hypothetical protein